MNKIIFNLLCLTIVSIGIASVAASDNATMDNASIQTIDQQHTVVDSNMSVENNLNNNTAKAIDNVLNDWNNSTVNVVNPGDAKKPVQNAPLNISCPKINSTGLHIDGPNLPSKTPKIELSKMDKDTFHYAKIFLNNPEWTIYDCLNYFFKNSGKSHYSWEQIAVIVARAHNIAFDKCSDPWKFTYDSYTTVNYVYNEIMENSVHFKILTARYW